MSIRQKFLKALQNLWKQILHLSRSITQRLKNWLLRSWFVLGRRTRFSSAGFVLPTVVMVILVVILVTTAMVFRSFDRAKNASNVRVSQRVLAAVNPAIDRAQAKINTLLADPTLPRGTPTDQAIYGAITGKLTDYTLGDETPLMLVSDVYKNKSITTQTKAKTFDENETLTTAWRFPLDTDNNGKFDSYTLYGLYFRNPTSSANRGRSPLEARATPMDNTSVGKDCGAGTSAGLVGNSGWYKTSDGNLKRSFFVFAATVPITDAKNLPTGKFESYKGNKGFAAIEFQQDQSRIPLTNNAVVYDDDLEITPGAGIKLNGRIMTNSNFIVGQGDNPVQFYQVSSTESCFYSEENAKITVGGNLIVGSLDPTRSIKGVKVDLFESGVRPSSPTLDVGNGTVSDPAVKASYNSQAYTARIDYLVKNTPPGPAALPPDLRAKVKNGADRTKELQNYFKDRTRRVPFAEVPKDSSNFLAGAAPPKDVGKESMRPGQDKWLYPANPATGTENNSLKLQRDQPPATNPNERSVEKEERIGDRILVGNGLPAQWWDPKNQRFINFYNQDEQDVIPTTPWTDKSGSRTRRTQFLPLSDLGDTSRDGFWERKAAEPPVQALDGVGGLRVVTGAGIYDPTTTRISRPDLSTSAIKDDFSTFEDETNPPPPGQKGFTVVLPDSTPMWYDRNSGVKDLDGKPEVDDEKGDLVMRATVVYHYRRSNYPNPLDSPYPNPKNPYQKAIACVSSYYDPSTVFTATNSAPNFGGQWKGPLEVVKLNSSKPGLSNNGISYQPPKAGSTGIPKNSGPNAKGLFLNPAPLPPSNKSASWRALLNYQANLIFPDGRFVNEPLRKALKQLDSGAKLTLAHQSAIDATLCGLQIHRKNITPDKSVIPHGTIYETSFLDARQIKAIESETLGKNFKSVATTLVPRIKPDYDLSLEDRQPLEIRVTVLNLEELRKRKITGTTKVVPDDEYLLPDSGIIYATRDDALPDLSAPGEEPPPAAKPTIAQAEKRMATRQINSPVDFILDPTRRPNGIMLINGNKLSRGTTNKWKTPENTEKGLILASNLPVYVQADQKGFNLHQNASSGELLEEFSDLQLGNNPKWSEEDFYENRKKRSPLFACRLNQPGLPDCKPGDTWRPATILADSVTLLSNNFRFGFRNEGDYDLRKNVENLDNNLKFKGYDFNNSGGDPLDTDPPVNEKLLGFDLNGNGVPTDTAVKETEITVTGARMINGFFDNNYVTSANSFNNKGFPDAVPATGGTKNEGSSYLNNFVTPIQRREQFPEYVMEICRKPLVSQCGPNDWFVGLATADLPISTTQTPPRPLAQREVRASDIPVGTSVKRLISGTTASPAPNLADQRYPRRLAFLRDASNNLLLDGEGTPVPLGIDSGKKVQFYSYNSPVSLPLGGSSVVGSPPAISKPNALWFRTTSDPTKPYDFNKRSYGYGSGKRLFYLKKLAGAGGVGTTQQPLLVPVLQIHTPTGKPGLVLNLPKKGSVQDETWLQKPPATPTKFNLVIAAGDNPTRDADTTLGIPAEFNGGMPNFPLLLEEWGLGNTDPTKGAVLQISGSFIQVKRNAYATAPFLSVLDATKNSINFKYPQKYETVSSTGKTPSYVAPNRQWGFDVGLLSQLPDLFSQQITTPSGGEPNKFYRELSRDDAWVKTLLCAATGEVNGPNITYKKYAVDDQSRPKDCLSISNYKLN